MAAILELLDADALKRTAQYADDYLVGRYQPPEDPSFLCDTHWCPLDANLTLPSPAQNPFAEVISRLCASPIFQAHVRRALRGCACAGGERRGSACGEEFDEFTPTPFAHFTPFSAVTTFA